MSELWDMLDEAQRADFEKALADGRLGNMVALWEPWWTTTEVLNDANYNAGTSACILSCNRKIVYED